MLSGTEQIAIFCNKVTLCVLVCMCVCMVILGIQTAVAIVTHQATCCALISVPRTALSLGHSNSWTGIKIPCDNEIDPRGQEGKCF